MDQRNGWSRDALLYCAGAAAAGLIALFAGIPQYREWGRIAGIPYLLAGVIALWGWVRRASVRRRTLLALATLALAAILPLSLEVAWRAHTAPALHDQSEAIVTEEAAKAVVHGRDPYATDYLHGPLAARPLGTKTHFPYLPGMLAFGLPRALSHDATLADARVAFAAFTLALGGVALWGSRGSVDRDRRLLVAQVLAVLPTGALLMATGGDDLPVLALLLLGLVLTDRGRPRAAGLAAGLAAATKQTAWLMLPFLARAARRANGEPAPGWFLGVAAVVLIPVVLPFVAWNPAAFVEDVIRFPLGLGKEKSAAGSPSLGTILVRAIPSARVPLTVLLVATVAALALYLVWRRPPASAAGAAGQAGLVLLAAIVLAPAARTGYLVYPINLFAWAWALQPHGVAGAGAKKSPILAVQVHPL